MYVQMKQLSVNGLLHYEQIASAYQAGIASAHYFKSTATAEPPDVFGSNETTRIDVGKVNNFDQT